MSNLHKIVGSDVAFNRMTGEKISSLEQLSSVLKEISPGEFSHHVNQTKNDFANWVEAIFENRFLANTLRALKTKDQMVIAIDVALNPHKKHDEVKHVSHAHTIVQPLIPQAAVEEKVAPTSTSHASHVSPHIVHSKHHDTHDDTHSANYNIHDHISHLDRETQHITRHHAHTHKPHSEPVTEDIKSKLIDFGFGLIIGIMIGFLLSKSIGIL